MQLNWKLKKNAFNILIHCIHIELEIPNNLDDMDEQSAKYQFLAAAVGDLIEQFPFNFK